MNYYHVTEHTNLESILKNGLKPSFEEGVDDEPGVYLFPSMDDLENALMNWLGDRIDDSQPIDILTIDGTGLTLRHKPGVEYEVWCPNVIPPSAIIHIEREEGQ